MCKVVSVSSCLIVLLEDIFFYLFPSVAITLFAEPNYPASLRRGKELCSFTILFLALNTHIWSTSVNLLVQAATHSAGWSCAGIVLWAAVRVPRAGAEPVPGQPKTEIVCCDTREFLAAWIIVCSPKPVLSFPWDYELFSVNSDVAESYSMYWPLAPGSVLSEQLNCSCSAHQTSAPRQFCDLAQSTLI